MKDSFLVENLMEVRFVLPTTSALWPLPSTKRRPHQVTVAASYSHAATAIGLKAWAKTKTLIRRTPLELESRPAPQQPLIWSTAVITSPMDATVHAATAMNNRFALLAKTEWVATVTKRTNNAKVCFNGRCSNFATRFCNFCLSCLIGNSGSRL